jgi:peptide-methionine (S)-S-oxide reductase
MTGIAKTRTPIFKSALAALIVAAAAAAFWQSPARSAEDAVVIPPPAMDEKAASGSEKAIFAGGCFWGVQGVFQHVKGVSQAVSGYTGGAKDDAVYETVGTGRTGHAESVRITYDPARITYGQLLRVFFSVAHDPTTLNRQGPDSGTEYRSAIFFQDHDQERIARAYVAQLDRTGVFPRPVVTAISALPGFYEAEDYHQDYATLHPDDSYIVINDAPKVANLKKLLPDLYVEPGKRR